MEPAAAAYELVHDALLSPHDRIKTLLASLPVLGKDAVDLEEPCPICLMPFSSVLADEADAGLNSAESNNEADEKEKDKEEALDGVTKLVGCGHIFCRREWVVLLPLFFFFNSTIAWQLDGMDTKSGQLNHLIGIFCTSKLPFAFSDI